MKTKEIEIGCRGFTLREDGTVMARAFKDLRGKEHADRKLKQFENNRGYLACGARVNGRSFTFLAHRVVAEVLLPGYSEDLQVDHIDGNKRNNSQSNLRMVTNAENSRAFRRKCRSYSSKYRGVHWRKDRKSWIVKIAFDGKSFYIGSFDCEIDAALAYDKAAIKLGYDCRSLNSTNHGI